MFFSSCGYRQGEHEAECFQRTINVPYVDGDIDGELTAAIVQEIATSGAYAYKSAGAELLLRVTIVEDSEENIGFRYDRSRKGKLQDWLVPVETRMTLKVDVELLDSASCCTLRGPARIQADVEYDHDFYTIRNQVNIFSLGQLTDVDSAQDVASSPLHQKLAEKIVDWLIYGW